MHTRNEPKRAVLFFLAFLALAGDVLGYLGQTNSAAMVWIGTAFAVSLGFAAAVMSARQSKLAQWLGIIAMVISIPLIVVSALMFACMFMGMCG